MIKTLALASCKHLELTLDPTPFPSPQLCWTWALAHVGECIWAIRTLTLSTHVVPSNETKGVLRFLHSPIEVDLPFFVDDFHLGMKLILDREAFVFALACSHYLFSSRPLGVVYELLWNCFIINDPMSGFDLFFKVCGHIIQDHVPSSLSCLFFASHLLTLEK